MGLAEKTQSKEGFKIGASEEILSYAVRLASLGQDMVAISEDVDRMRMIIEQNVVYEGGARNDIWFYYKRLNEMVAKLCNHYVIAAKCAEDAYYSLTRLDELIAGMFTLMGFDNGRGDGR